MINSTMQSAVRQVYYCQASRRLDKNTEVASLCVLGNLSCLVLHLAGKKQPVPEWTPKRAAGLVTKERLVAKLSTDVLGLVDLAIRALMDDLWWARTGPQNPVRHDPWLDEIVRVLDGHLVSNFIAFSS